MRRIVVAAVATTLPGVLLAALLAAGAAAQSPPTVAEQSGFTRTATHAEVLAFLDALKAHPRAARLRVETVGESAGRKPIVCAFVAEPALAPDAWSRSTKLRVLVNANIHGGEVEGKETAQILIRELLDGQHDGLLQDCLIAFVPDFNPDGNDRIDRKNRVDQNGPDEGVGRRENGDGLDLNRDFVKLETPECRALVELMRRLDPHVFMDLHTTDGSHHGYHLTYARSLAVNQDPELVTAGDALLAATQQALAAGGVRSFDYGDFATVDGRRCWQTFDHLPRYATNYAGMQNRLALLCEAYSHLGYADRVRVTRAFVLEALRSAVQQKAAIQQACTAADLRPGGKEPLALGFASKLVDDGEREVLVGSCERVPIEGVGTRLVAKPEFTTERMPVRAHFAATRSRPLPREWALVGVSDATLTTLRAHGIALERQAKEEEVEAEVFAPAKIDQGRRSFQKHLATTFTGEWRKTTLRLPAATWLVTAQQPRARLAAQLLEPESEDSLATWNHFDPLARVPGADEEPGKPPLTYPVLRVTRLPKAK